jgi:molybdopterin/thiamine biosynthesis adenylyltransferase
MLKYVVFSVAGAEFGVVFVNDKEATLTHTTLSEMGPKQDAIVLKTDKSTAVEIINKTVQQSAPKPWI